MKSMASDSKEIALTPHQQRAVSVEASVHPSSVVRYFLGDRLQPMTRERIEKALVKLGHGALVRKAGV